MSRSSSTGLVLVTPLPPSAVVTVPSSGSLVKLEAEQQAGPDRADHGSGGAASGLNQIKVLPKNKGVISKSGIEMKLEMLEQDAKKYAKGDGDTEVIANENVEESSTLKAVALGRKAMPGGNSHSLQNLIDSKHLGKQQVSKGWAVGVGGKSKQGRAGGGASVGGLSATGSSFSHTLQGDATTSMRSNVSNAKGKPERETKPLLDAEQAATESLLRTAPARHQRRRVSTVEEKDEEGEDKGHEEDAFPHVKEFSSFSFKSPRTSNPSKQSEGVRLLQVSQGGLVGTTKSLTSLRPAKSSVTSPTSSSSLSSSSSSSSSSLSSSLLSSSSKSFSAGLPTHNDSQAEERGGVVGATSTSVAPTLRRSNSGSQDGKSNIKLLVIAPMREQGESSGTVLVSASGFGSGRSSAGSPGEVAEENLARRNGEPVVLHLENSSEVKNSYSLTNDLSPAAAAVSALSSSRGEKSQNHQRADSKGGGNKGRRSEHGGDRKHNVEGSGGWFAAAGSSGENRVPGTNAGPPTRASLEGTNDGPDRQVITTVDRCNGEENGKSTNLHVGNTRTKDDMQQQGTSDVRLGSEISMVVPISPFSMDGVVAFTPKAKEHLGVVSAVVPGSPSMDEVTPITPKLKEPLGVEKSVASLHGPGGNSLKMRQDHVHDWHSKDTFIGKGKENISPSPQGEVQVVHSHLRSREGDRKPAVVERGAAVPTSLSPDNANVLPSTPRTLAAGRLSPFPPSPPSSAGSWVFQASGPHRPPPQVFEVPNVIDDAPEEMAPVGPPTELPRLRNFSYVSEFDRDNDTWLEVYNNWLDQDAIEDELMEHTLQPSQLESRGKLSSRKKEREEEGETIREGYEMRSISRVMREMARSPKVMTSTSQLMPHSVADVADVVEEDISETYHSSRTNW
ncbi:hypothetical protein CBR_g31920 [Chara braunii]|uniref:Uncharacterized protein n=1 Tax=Chara braunii TaxID=69332 RepID=A0A388LG18_CHABU|nr:hypothetical protein CBR_g31920 [Chara braunii]|eukprot:GBG81248.1 hypothetical protein CBR_g31920 [Chara braunii]